MLDALAYTKAARADGVPTALELSQSGRGAHAWVFFADRVPARTARTIGTALVHEVLRGSMDLTSYDRLFPNQDVLPDGGFGNLIAAPIQGRRRQEGLTLFLDLATLEPHDDQWAFLSTLDRLSPADAAAVARRVGRADVGAEVRALSPPTASRVRPSLPAVVRAELGAGLTLDSTDLTPAAMATSSTPRPLAKPEVLQQLAGAVRAGITKEYIATRPQRGPLRRDPRRTRRRPGTRRPAPLCRARAQGGGGRGGAAAARVGAAVTIG